MSLVTFDRWGEKLDIWYVTVDRCEEVNLLSKFQLSSSYGFGVRGDTWHRHLTPEMWHITYDMCHMTHRGWWTLCQNMAKAISAKLLGLNLKNKLQETCKYTIWNANKQGQTEKNWKKKTPKTRRKWMILKETEINRKKNEETWRNGNKRE